MSKADSFMSVTMSLLASGHKVRFRASGQSMSPSILDGEYITVEPKRADEISVGDIVVYFKQNALLAHRLIAVERERYILRGDSANFCDHPVSAEDIAGRVICVERDGREFYIIGPRARFKAYLYTCISRLRRIRDRLYDLQK
jgi:signal peptidase I